MVQPKVENRNAVVSVAVPRNQTITLRRKRLTSGGMRNNSERRTKQRRQIKPNGCAKRRRSGNLSTKKTNVTNSRSRRKVMQRLIKLRRPLRRQLIRRTSE